MRSMVEGRERSERLHAPEILTQPTRENGGRNFLGH
jgi:hypothetical protein